MLRCTNFCICGARIPNDTRSARMFAPSLTLPLLTTDRVSFNGVDVFRFAVVLKAESPDFNGIPGLIALTLIGVNIAPNVCPPVIDLLFLYPGARLK